MTGALFRQEALSHQGERLWGDLLVSQPLSATLITSFFTLITALTLMFLSQNDYLRKQTVPGILVPDSGLAEIRAPATSTVAALHVVTNAVVDAGTPLFTLQLDATHTPDAGLTNLLQEQVTKQIKAGQIQIEIEQKNTAAITNKFAILNKNLQQRLQQIAALAANAQLLLQVKQKALTRAESLRDRGLLALSDFEQVYALVLDQQGVIEQFGLDLQQTHGELDVAQADQNSQEFASAREQQRLTAEQAELQKQLLRLGAEQSSTVVAPIAGRITSILRHVGMSVNAGEQMMVLVPLHTKLQAELLLPSSARGFVAVGQAVTIRYDAFSYQKFGVQDATVLSVDTSAVMSKTGAEMVPMYKVVATLAKQSISAYGYEEKLLPGMVLSADVVVDKRSLLEWLLEPLLSIRGKL